MRPLKHFSIDQMLAMEEKERINSMSPEKRKALRQYTIQQMEKQDPNGDVAHAIASRYRDKQEYKPE